eukprot:Skav228920  [mRNA]  locus=scaffold2504:136942:144114:+ [translate_table: standard]
MEWKVPRQVAYEDVRKAVKLKSLNRGWRTPDPSPTRDADAEKEGAALKATCLAEKTGRTTKSGSSNRTPLMSLGRCRRCMPQHCSRSPGTQAGTPIRATDLLGRCLPAVPSGFELAHLEQSDLVFVDRWGIFPHIIAPEDGTDMEDLVEQLGGAGVVVLGVHNGGGMIFNKDGLVEPVRQMIQDISEGLLIMGHDKDVPAQGEELTSPRVLLSSSSQPWIELPEDFRKELQVLQAPQAREDAW